MSLRPKLTVDMELSYYQIGEVWRFVATLKEGDSSNDWFPDTATITITHRGGGALSTPVSGASMTVSDQTISYTMAAGLITSPERRLRAVITVENATDGSFQESHFFDAVRFSPRIPATAADVAALMPDFTRFVTNTDPDSQKVLREGWRKVLIDVKRKGAYPQFILDTEDLKEGHILRTRALIYGSNMGDGDGEIADSHEYWLAQYKEWIQTLQLDLDEDESGTLEPDEERRGFATVRFGRFPR